MNKLYFGDCLDVLKDMYAKHPQGLIDLIYIDPPFNSKRNYNILFEDVDMTDTKAQKEAFADTWTNVSYIDTLNELADLNDDLYQFLKTLNKINISKSSVAYLTTMAIRIYYIHKVLKNTGSFYLHCDPQMSHYLKLLCDLIFIKKLTGKNYRNEIIWCYRGGGSPSSDFGKRHDVIFRYVKNKKNFTFNADPIRIPYEAEGIGRKDDSMWGKHKGVDTIYKPNPLGKVPEDWWKMNILNANDPERLGYPTQKPLALMERIIKASSNEGDLVADFFCGCGTTIAAANKLNRNWIGVDISHLAIKLILERLTKPIAEEGRKKFLLEIEVHGFPKDIASAKELAEKDRKGRFEFQAWVVEFLLGGILNPKQTADGGWDGHITFWKGPKEKGKVLIEVKSGNVNVKNMREFINVVNTTESDLGVFVCFAGQVTKPMALAAKEAGRYKGYQFDRIQIVTIEGLLNGKEIKMPGGVDQTTFKKATKDSRPEIKVKGMFD